jgi:NitT/TauT family transport system substrate-binding protein
MAVLGPWWIAPLAVCLVATGCKALSPQSPEKLVIASAHVPQAALMHVALSERYFAAEGLEVAVKPYPFGRPALAAVLAGEADVATVAETPVVFATLKGQHAALLATISSTTRNNAVLSRRDKAIASTKDLAGKRVGVSRGTTGEFFLEMTLVRGGVRRESLTFVDLNPEDMEGALRRGEIDAVATWAPYFGLLEKHFGGELVSLVGESDYAETFDVVVRPEFVEKRPATVAKVLRALLRAEDYAREHPQSARGIAAAALGVDPVELEEVWSTYDLRVRLDQSLFVLMDEEARWAVRSGLAAKQDTPDFRSVVAPAPLLVVRPASVHLIR